MPGQSLLYQVFLGCPNKTSVDLYIVIGGVVYHQNTFGSQIWNQFVFQPTNNHYMVHFSMVFAIRAKSPEHNLSLWYESPMYPAWNMIILSLMNKLILCKVKSSDSNMHGQRWMFANSNETGPSSLKGWFSMPVVREWHMHAKWDQNILCGQKLWTFSRTVNGQSSGRTKIVIIVQT